MHITYTLTGESSTLATYSFLPIIKAFLGKANIRVVDSNISLSDRVIAEFSESLKEERRCGNALANLGELVKKANANLIRTPDISASIPQLKTTIEEL